LDLIDELVYRYGLYVYSFIDAMRAATGLAAPSARDIRPTSMLLRRPASETQPDQQRLAKTRSLKPARQSYVQTPSIGGHDRGSE